MRKLIFVLTGILQTSLAVATSPSDLYCDLSKEKTSLAKVVKESEVVGVTGHNTRSGHIWTSGENLESELVEKSSRSSMEEVAFHIDVSKQQEIRKSYVFYLKRPWESHFISSCEVTLVKEEKP